MEKIKSVGELDFIESKSFNYEILMYPPNIPQSTIKKDGKFTYQKSIFYGEGKWLLNGDDFKMYNVLKNNPFDKTKINIYLSQGHETDRTRKIKEDKEREQAEKARQEQEQAEEKARIDAEERKQLEEERNRAWEADAPNRAIREAAAKVKKAEEEAQKEAEAKATEAEKKRVREAEAESLRKRIDAGEPAKKGNVFKDDLVFISNGVTRRDAKVIDEWYKIEYSDGSKDVVSRDGLFNMTAVERTLKQEAINNSKRHSGGTRKRRKRKTKTR